MAGPDETHPGILNEVAEAVPAASRWHGGWMRFQKMGRDNHNHGFKKKRGEKLRSKRGQGGRRESLSDQLNF